MKLILGTASTLKLGAVKTVIVEFSNKNLLKTEVNIFTKTVNQNLPKTPYGDDTYAFAKKRIQLLKTDQADGDFYVALESGVINRHGNWYEECWCVISDKIDNFYSGYSSGLAIPTFIAERLEKGEEHFEIIDSLGVNNPKATWNLYTNGTILREKSIEEAFRNAFYYAVTS
jgi:non-canonical (house-cleaning) NTP pyrophosphatase